MVGFVVSSFKWVFASVVALGVVLTATVEGPRAEPPLRLDPCHLDGLTEEVRCGALTVYENRDTARGRMIPIHVTVVPALIRDAERDPLVVLSGGPGQGARTYASLIARFFQRVRRTRDIVLVDLRGTGDSAPLKCPPPHGMLGMLAISDNPRDAAGRCLAALDADPRYYTHRYALADLHDVLQTLGYPRINLWGGSWGTRSALIFAATYPDLVRSAVLDGAVAASMDFPWSYPVDAQRALDRLFEDCREDPACHAAFPFAPDEVRQWLDTLERVPFAGTVRHPRSAASVEIRLDRAAATEILRAALYSPVDASRIMLTIRRSMAGDRAPLMAMAERASSWSVDTMALGQTMSVLCSEDVGRYPAPAAPAATLFGRFAIDFWLEACSVWPKGTSHDVSDRTILPIPALILSGDLDPVTPPARGEAMRHHFPNSLHVIAPGGGHNISYSGCIPRLIAEFVDRGGLEGLDSSCATVIARPPFVTSFAGGLP